MAGNGWSTIESDPGVFTVGQGRGCGLCLLHFCVFARPSPSFPSLLHNQPLPDAYKQALAHDFGARGAQIEEIVTMDDSGLRNLNLNAKTKPQHQTCHAHARHGLGRRSPAYLSHVRADESGHSLPFSHTLSLSLVPAGTYTYIFCRVCAPGACLRPHFPLQVDAGDGAGAHSENVLLQ